MKLLFVLVCTLAAWPTQAQTVDPARYGALQWRAIGPYRGGRTVGAAGVPQQPNVFYIGVNNGGVWKTTDYGLTWTPIFDSQPTQSLKSSRAGVQQDVDAPVRDHDEIGVSIEVEVGGRDVEDVTEHGLNLVMQTSVVGGFLRLPERSLRETERVVPEDFVRLRAAPRV